MKKKLKIAIPIIAVVIVILIIMLALNSNKAELVSVKSNKELLKIYGSNEDTMNNKATYILTLPFSFWFQGYGGGWLAGDVVIDQAGISMETNTSSSSKNFDGVQVSQNTTSSSVGASNGKDYSKTNVQVENVDEADITKTDGDYIYSISENNVVITDVRDPEHPKIASNISNIDDSIPEEMILYKNQLVVISALSENYSRVNTIVRIYHIINKEKPELIKEYELYASYFTTRCIDNKLYVISSDYLRKENKEIISYYKEDKAKKEIGYDNIKYFKGNKSVYQTLISTVDLSSPVSDIKVEAYLINTKNVYVSENSIYFLKDKYDYTQDVPPISSILGLKGIFGAFEYESDDDETSDYVTEIYKFDIDKNAGVVYKAKAETEGRTINQYSLDEQNGHLRIALYGDKGTKITILDGNLKLIGESDYVAKGEQMYSSRFIGDKAYAVTYKTIDPLFVFDLSDETKPKVLGELKIPGYSTYLHPYDENYLIGIGMETRETVRRNSAGRVTGTSASIVGMKMALFDISDVENPKTVSTAVIGDSRTTSSILTNPKALLFSKERNLIAIPVNNYNEDFEVSTSTSDYTGMISSYKNYNKKRIAEGYLVYDISPENGFKLKGEITHEIDDSNKNNYYRLTYGSKLLRGLYIDENLFTVSENLLKVHKLNDLSKVSELKIKY